MKKVTDKLAEAISEKNEKYMERVGWNVADVAKLLGMNRCPMLDDKDFIRRIMQFQDAEGLKVDGIVGNVTYSHLERRGMTEKERVIAALFDTVIAFESGGKADAFNADSEFRGLVDKRWKRLYGKKHPASGTSHIGASVGWGQATQDSGSLGKLFRAFLNKNPDKFKLYMGPTWLNLMAVVEAKGPAGFPRRILRGPRVQKVLVSIGGEMVRKDIWEEPWRSRIKAMLRDTEFRQVQREFFFNEYFLNRKVSGFLRKNNLLSAQAAAIAFNRSIHSGQSRVDDLLEPCLGKGSEEEILKCVARRYHRAEEIMSDRSLPPISEKWEGWDHF